MFLRAAVLIYGVACFSYFGTLRAMCLFVIPPILWILWARFLNTRPSTRVEFLWTSLVFIIAWFVPLVIWYVHLGIHASPEPWGAFNTDLSPVGKSGCCRGLECAPYHPAGFFTSASTQVPKTSQSEPILFCPVGNWADSNGLSPVPYNKKGLDEIGDPCIPGLPCDGLATQDSKDWPNLAFGLKEKWTSGAVVSELAMCPGTARLNNAKGYLGKGMEICSTCRYPRPTHCKDMTRSQLYCFACPGGYFGSEPQPQSARHIRLTAELLFGMFLFMTMSTCVSIPQCGKNYPKSYNPVF